ncbi:MAG: hypothetical protein H6737_22795 [Alphaproteobacteria bacterium]|nr:hypothetical protein [Alphaproteobacteria bacterium]
MEKHHDDWNEFVENDDCMQDLLLDGLTHGHDLRPHDGDAMLQLLLHGLMDEGQAAVLYPDRMDTEEEDDEGPVYVATLRRRGDDPPVLVLTVYSAALERVEVFDETDALDDEDTGSHRIALRHDALGA